MDQRRFLLALVLSFLLLLAYEQLVVRPYRKALPSPPQTQGQVPGQLAPEAERQTSPGARPANPEAPAAAAPGSGLAAPAADAPTVTIETDLVRATVTKLGARLKSLELKDFRETVKPDSPLLDLVTPSPVLPLTIELGAGSSDADISYEASSSSIRVSGPEQAEVVFQGSTVDGRTIEKRYRFLGNSYLFDLVVSGSAIKGSAGLVLTPVSVQAASGGQTSGNEQAVAFANAKLIEKSVESLTTPIEVQGSAWTGFSAQYFAALGMPHSGTGTAWLAKAEGIPIARLDTPTSDGDARFQVFLGPKEREILAGAGHQLERAIDFGWFWFIALPLLWGLRALYRIIPNYGVAIILLTAIVKLVTAPLTRSSFKSMKAMQKLQPDMQRLRERHKDDQVAMQKEMMELYKRHRVNPVSGCLPMMLQLPIFVGLYNALLHAIELRHAPFMLWINDLSAPDRLMIGGIGIPVLVLLMGASMLVQQLMTPQQGDPTQQRMMMIMPVVFTFISMNFPSGLVLYWLVNNLLTMAQQWFMLNADGTNSGKA
jgi:YidC/Oxa1 family membrane protein insertase